MTKKEMEQNIDHLWLNVQQVIDMREEDQKINSVRLLLNGIAVLVGALIGNIVVSVFLK